MAVVWPALWLLAAAALASGAGQRNTSLHVAVLDPLARRNACACVKGYAQRDYRALARHITLAVGRDVALTFGLSTAKISPASPPDVLIAKCSMIESVPSLRKRYERIALLSGKDGRTTLEGFLVVRSRDRARTVADLRRRRIALGPADEEEKHGAILRLLKRYGVDKPVTVVRDTCNIAALDVVEGRADAAAISSYAMPLLTGCGTIRAGTLRVIGRTQSLPFIGVFVLRDLDPELRSMLVRALMDVREQPPLLQALESRDGFVLAASAPNTRVSRAGAAAGPSAMAGNSEWSDWRGGPRRDALVLRLPATLPQRLQAVWTRPMESSSPGGVSVAGGKVYCSDKSADGTRDVWLCLDAATGREVWRLEYPAAGRMDYSNSPRAAPVVVGKRVFLLGAFGHLHAVDADTGAVFWRRDLVRDFGGSVPTWGLCATPVVTDGLVIVPTGSPRASLAALDASSGRTVWSAPGRPPSYGNAIVATIRGVRQVIWHDKETLGGWDVMTGKRLWTVRPPNPNDFNVPTPVLVGDRLLVATENNGVRLYGFGADGRLASRPLARNDAVRTDTVSPVIVDGVAWAVSPSGAFAMDLSQGLKTIWKREEAPFLQHASLIGAPGRLLMVMLDGTVCLMPSRPARTSQPLMRRLPVHRPADDDEIAVWSHPALVGDRLYVRTNRELVCIRVP